MILRAIVAGVLLAMCCAPTRAQDAGAPAPASHQIGGPGSARVPKLAERLEHLLPDHPRGYFELGEELAAEISDDADRRLVRELYVLAFELDRGAKVHDPPLGESICLALAAIAETDDERRWLTAMGETLAPEGTPDLRRIKATTASRDPAAFDLATMLSYVRIGDGRRAQRILDKPGVSQLLDKCDKLLMPGVGGATQVRQYIDEWPTCSQCHGRRFIKDGTGVHLCPTCHGLPGPTLSQIELVGQIRTESVLLSGQQRSWAGQIISDSGATLRELDPSELAATYHTDTSRPLWRNSTWVQDPNASKPPTQPGQPSDVPAPDGSATPSKQSN